MRTLTGTTIRGVGLWGRSTRQRLHASHRIVGGGELSALGFTLDHYGSMFVSALAKSFVLKHFPQIKYFQLAARYPANCVLSSPGDGRHFGQGNYYLAKARMLVHVVGNASFH